MLRTISARLGNAHPLKRLDAIPQMELKMINLKVLSTVATMALVLPMAASTASFAQAPHGGKANFAARSGGVRPSGGAGWHGGGGGYRRSGGAFIPGAVAGALVGGAIASQGYYGGPGYYAPGYAPGYYDDQSYDDGAVAIAPAPGGDDGGAYCMQTYRSYDPQSGTYLGNDGYRHPCP